MLTSSWRQSQSTAALFSSLPCGITIVDVVSPVMSLAAATSSCDFLSSVEMLGIPLQMTDPNFGVFLPILILFSGPFLGEKGQFWVFDFSPITEPYFWGLKKFPKTRIPVLGFLQIFPKMSLFLGSSQFFPIIVLLFRLSENFAIVS